MLAVISETPRDPSAWLRWSFHHRSSHQRIIDAITKRGGPRLILYPIDPITKGSVGDFLQGNSQLHSDMNGALGLQGSDLLSIDFDNQNQLIAWIALHYEEHRSAELKLGI